MSKFEKWKTTREDYERELRNEIESAIVEWNKRENKTESDLTDKIIDILKKPRVQVNYNVDYK